MSTREIFVAGAARTAIGTFGGALKDVPNTQLATLAVKTAIARAGIADFRRIDGHDGEVEDRVEVTSLAVNEFAIAESHVHPCR